MLKFLTPRTPRLATAERRAQIVEATLRVLSHTPIESLTTRQIAVELGLSQPAMFRHFPSKEALLLAVVEHARANLERMATTILESDQKALALVAKLGRGLLEHAEQEPALPRLLFASARPEAGPVRDALRHVVAMQASLVAEIVRQAQREGEIRPTCDPDHAATLFIGMLQGLILRWEFEARKASLPAGFEPLFDLFLHGMVEPGSRRNEGGPGFRDAADALPVDPPALPLAALDVRPLVASGVDPLPTILAALSGLQRGGVLVVEAPFRPTPLLALLRRRGHGIAVEPIEQGSFRVDVVIGGGTIEDLRDLEPPEPLERVLVQCAALEHGAAYLARLPRFPKMLVPLLQERGVAFDLLEAADGTALLRIVKTA